jgi:hypothetical protein
MPSWQSLLSSQPELNAGAPYHEWQQLHYADPAAALDLFGDFEICPTEPFRKGAVQHAKVVVVTHRCYIKRP